MNTPLKIPSKSCLRLSIPSFPVRYGKSEYESCVNAQVHVRLSRARTLTSPCKFVAHVQGTARASLKAAGYDTNLAAEYCVTGIPPGRIPESSGPQSSVARAPGANSSGNNSSTAATATATAGTTGPSSRRTGGYGFGSTSASSENVSGVEASYRAWTASNGAHPPEGGVGRGWGTGSMGGATRTSAATGGLDWRTSGRRGGAGTGAGSGSGVSGGFGGLGSVGRATGSSTSGGIVDV